MDIIEYLNNNRERITDVKILSSAFIELTLQNPCITIWEENNIINITSKKDYNLEVYYNKEVKKICDVDDYDMIIDIYRVTNGYTPKDEKIDCLIEIFDNKQAKKYN